MKEVVTFLEEVVHYAAEIGIHLVELVGIVILLVSAAQGIIGGYADGRFKPNNNITRGQMAKILYNLM